MDAKTLEALKASIAKWEKNAEAKTPDDYLLGAVNCPLCAEFHHNGCVGCPVFALTGKFGCRGTPYDTAEDTADEWEEALGDNLDYDEIRAAAHAIARAEVEFLKSLLPAGEVS